MSLEAQTGCWEASLLSVIDINQSSDCFHQVCGIARLGYVSLRAGVHPAFDVLWISQSGMKDQRCFSVKGPDLFDEIKA